ncbi:MAG: hypothetical protein JNL62_03470 [Bryobacterales bacterium]|nr:hypothetical protein [Bryobacterales bacterium]
MTPRRISVWPAGLFAGLLWLVSAAVIPGVTPSPDRVVYGFTESGGCGSTQLPSSSSVFADARGECSNPRAAFSLFAELAGSTLVAPRLVRGAFAGAEHPAPGVYRRSAYRGRGPPVSF